MCTWLTLVCLAKAESQEILPLKGVGRPTGLRTCFKPKEQYECTSQADMLETIAAAGSLAAQNNTNVPKDTRQVLLTAVHPSPLQHGCWLLWTSKGAFATQGSWCILTVGHNMSTYILQEKEGLQARETTTQLAMHCLEECPSPVHASTCRKPTNANTSRKE